MNLVRRVVFVAWQNLATRGIFPVARLFDRQIELRWEFAYIQGARAAAREGFVPFVGLGGLDDVTRSAELPPFFANRVMRKSRPDFPLFMTRLGLPTQGESEVPILARSEGLRASDTIELFGLPTFDEGRRRYRFLFFLRGIRHVENAEHYIERLNVGDRLDLQDDRDNVVDGLAIRIHEGDGRKIGWVPATLLEDLHDLRKRGSQFTVSVERINPHPGTIQTRVLCRLEATYVDGFVPLATPRYQPISVDATLLHVVPAALAG